MQPRKWAPYVLHFLLLPIPVGISSVSLVEECLARVGVGVEVELPLILVPVSRILFHVAIRGGLDWNERRKREMREGANKREKRRGGRTTDGRTPLSIIGVLLLLSLCSPCTCMLLLPSAGIITHYLLMK